MHYFYRDFLRIRAVMRNSDNMVEAGLPQIFFRRSTCIGPHLIDHIIIIYNGKKWRKVRVNKFMVGRKVGEFTWNRKFSLKKKKKKKKK